MRHGLRKHLQAETFVKVDFVFTQNTASGWRLSTALAARGVTKKAMITVKVNPGVYVAGLTFDTAPAHSRIRLSVEGNIVGTSGGGDALVTSLAMTVDNKGLIAGGGGNGGAGGNGSHGGLTAGRVCAYGVVMAGGAGGRGAGMVGTALVTATNGGAGASASDSGARGGVGGNGGGLGLQGNSGSPGYTGNSWPGGTLTDDQGNPTFYPACGPYQGGISAPGAAGGSAGYAVRGINNVLFVQRGTLTGPTI